MGGEQHQVYNKLEGIAPKGWNVSCFSSFSVAGDTNVNMSSCLETGGEEGLGMRLECCTSQ